MRHLLRVRPSPAMIVALIALFVALGGTAVALNGSNTVQSDDLGPGAQVKAPDVATNAVNGSDVVDFSLSNRDVGVLFAEVSANGTLANSSGGVTSTKLEAGNYEVDFGRNVRACTAVATIGPSGLGSATGEVTVADRGGNVQAVYVDTSTSSGADGNRPFRLVVVC